MNGWDQILTEPVTFGLVLFSFFLWLVIDIIKKLILVMKGENMNGECGCLQCNCGVEEGLYKDNEFPSENQNWIQIGDFPLHSGGYSQLKFELDKFTNTDWEAIAYLISKRFSFSHVVGIPTGGMRLANALSKYSTTSGAPLIIVDDVWSTGGSMRAMQKEYPNDEDTVIGVVAIARTPTDDWVYPFLQMPEGWD